MFSHRSHESAVHVTLTTESNSSLSMTPGHYLWVTKGDDNRPAIVRAGDVQAGDMVWALEDPGFIATRSYATKITSTTCSRKAGLYNPHTPSGHLVVNNLMALTFTETLPASLTWHSAVTMPAKILYHVLPKSIAQSLNQIALSTYFGFSVEKVLAQASNWQAMTILRTA